MYNTLLARSWIILTLLGSPTLSFGAIDAKSVFQADDKKKDFYAQEGLFIGGDRAVKDVIVKEVRWSTQKNYERIVIDLKTPLQRPPYFQFSVSQSQNRIVGNIWGRPTIDLKTADLKSLLKKSQMVEGVELYPRVADQPWTFLIKLKPGAKVEVFELRDPVRIILDIQLKKS